ncbi:MAG: hypothetical protein QOF63_1729 [Thermoanaerobaculia bacterium]|jgi:mannosidase alpha-like ER degradation enhancer 2|nr:hypothetical protein [Thermoanaerobaculia bacterium]
MSGSPVIPPYLLFAPDSALDLDKVVFNTEAHPLKRTW